MIDYKSVCKYCKEAPTLIENYDKAINDTTQTWDCHHRLETELNLSKQDLIDRDIYFNRPASELIFLTHTEHIRIHHEQRWSDPENIKQYSEKMKQYWSDIENKKQQSEKMKQSWSTPEHRKHRSEHMKGKIKDRPWMSKLGESSVRPKLDEIDYYLNLGYHFGRK